MPLEVRILFLVLIVLALAGALPTYPYSRNWGYYPSGFVFLILVIFLLFWIL